MYGIGSNSAKSSAANSRRCSPAASMRPASSSAPRFCWLPMPGPVTRRSPGASAWAARPCTGSSAASWKANLERALSEELRPGAERKLTGKEEALLVATACATPPRGCTRWTLDLLAGALVKLTEYKSLSRETVRRRLAENDLKPWRKDMWCIPQVDGEYVARMEDVLDLYAEAPDPGRPVVCLDESPVQLIGEVRQPIPPRPGRLERYDCEYRRWDGQSVRSPRRASPPGGRSSSPSAERQKTIPMHARPCRHPLSRCRARPRRAG